MWVIVVGIVLFILFLLILFLAQPIETVAEAKEKVLAASAGPPDLEAAKEAEPIPSIEVLELGNSNLSKEELKKYGLPGGGQIKYNMVNPTHLAANEAILLVGSFRSPTTSINGYVYDCKSVEGKHSLFMASIYKSLMGNDVDGKAAILMTVNRLPVTHWANYVKKQFGVESVHVIPIDGRTNSAPFRYTMMIRSLVKSNAEAHLLRYNGLQEVDFFQSLAFSPRFLTSEATHLYDSVETAEEVLFQSSKKLITEQGYEIVSRIPNREIRTVSCFHKAINCGGKRDEDFTYSTKSISLEEDQLLGVVALNHVASGIAVYSSVLFNERRKVTEDVTGAINDEVADNLQMKLILHTPSNGQVSVTERVLTVGKNPPRQIIPMQVFVLRATK
jgi:hypothetical protein